MYFQIRQYVPIARRQCAGKWGVPPIPRSRSFLRRLHPLQKHQRRRLTIFISPIFISRTGGSSRYLNQIGQIFGVWASFVSYISRYMSLIRPSPWLGWRDFCCLSENHKIEWAQSSALDHCGLHAIPGVRTLTTIGQLLVKYKKILFLNRNNWMWTFAD